MTDLMAKDLDLAIDYAATSGTPVVHLRDRPPDPRFGERGRIRAGGLLRDGQGDPGARRAMTVLTLDLGTSATKAASGTTTGWSRSPAARSTLCIRGLVGPSRTRSTGGARSSTRARSSAATRPTSTGRSRRSASPPHARRSRRSDAELEPLGPGILWSDQRGGAGVLHFGDPDDFRARTGVVLNAACCAAKVAWLVDHEPELIESARWLLAPRDFVAARLTGQVLTDETLASRTGLYGLDGTVGVAERDRLPASAGAPGDDGRRPGWIRPTAWPSSDSGPSPPSCSAAATGRARCVGTGAGDETPMVSWGTTTNVSIPHPGPIGVLPTVAAVSRGALAGTSSRPVCRRAARRWTGSSASPVGRPRCCSPKPRPLLRVRTA